MKIIFLFAMLDAKKLLQLKALGAVFFTIKECALVLEVPLHELKKLIDDEDTPEAKNYHTGYLQSKFLYHKNTIDYASRGSSKANDDVGKMILKSKAEN